MIGPGALRDLEDVLGYCYLNSLSQLIIKTQTVGHNPDLISVDEFCQDPIHDHSRLYIMTK